MATSEKEADVRSLGTCQGTIFKTVDSYIPSLAQKRSGAQPMPFSLYETFIATVMHSTDGVRSVGLWLEDGLSTTTREAVRGCSTTAYILQLIRANMVVLFACVHQAALYL